MIDEQLDDEQLIEQSDATCLDIIRKMITGKLGDFNKMPPRYQLKSLKFIVDNALEMTPQDVRVFLKEDDNQR